MDIKERQREGEKGLRQVERFQAGRRREELRHLLFPRTGPVPFLVHEGAATVPHRLSRWQW